MGRLLHLYCVGEYSTACLTIESSILLTRTGTVTLTNGGQRIPSCKRRWQAYRNFNTCTAVRVHQVDFCPWGCIRHRHLLCQDLRVHLHSTLHQQDSAGHALLHLCPHGILDPFDP